MGMLGSFKYFNFFAAGVSQISPRSASNVSLPVLNLMLPVGISFFTFQALSYTIGVYRGTLRARRNFVDFAIFVAFFPQLVAGPIERAAHLLPQVERPRRFSVWGGEHGTAPDRLGRFKKLVVADSAGVSPTRSSRSRRRLSPCSGPACSRSPFRSTGTSPPTATSRAEPRAGWGSSSWGTSTIRTWREGRGSSGARWHISLSTWFRDYVYVPLGGSRRGPARRSAHHATFLLSGLWHGASWNFVAWGRLPRALLVGSRLAARFCRPGATAAAVLLPLRIAATFVLVHIGWLIFRETHTPMLLRTFAEAGGDSMLDRRRSCRSC